MVTVCKPCLKNDLLDIGECRSAKVVARNFNINPFSSRIRFRLPFDRYHQYLSMPLRPFPLPVNVGIDIVSVNRIRGILLKGHDNFRRYLRRFLTPQERSIVLRQYGDADLTDRRTMGTISHLLAGRHVSSDHVL